MLSKFLYRVMSVMILTTGCFVDLPEIPARNLSVKSISLPQDLISTKLEGLIWR